MCKGTKRVYSDGCIEDILHYRAEVAYSENAFKCDSAVTKYTLFFSSKDAKFHNHTK